MLFDSRFVLYVGADRLGWSFRSLWAARLMASEAAGAAGVPVYVVGAETGLVYFSFERGADSLTRCVYADPDALKVLQDGAIYNQSAAGVVA